MKIRLLILVLFVVATILFMRIYNRDCTNKGCVYISVQEEKTDTTIHVKNGVPSEGLLRSKTEDVIRVKKSIYE